MERVPNKQTASPARNVRRNLESCIRRPPGGSPAVRIHELATLLTDEWQAAAAGPPLFHLFSPCFFFLSFFSFLHGD